MDSDASATTKMQPLATHADGSAGSVLASLLHLHPETWNAVLDKAAKQTNTFPAGMSNATEPAYCYLPQQGEA